MKGAERLSASAAVARLAAGDLTCEELVRACLDRAQERAVLEAWAFLDPDHALAQARAIDRAGRPGLLKGVPVGVKDIIDTADMPTEHGSPIYRGNRPFADAACAALIRAAGGIVLGKTVTTEFANRHPGATRNPHNPAHTPGGSSSGSAAAVADFHLPLGLGTQTGGSVIRPAAFCGVIGYKPSFGDFSRVGVKMQSHTLDTLGIIARTLEDVVLLRAVLLGESARPAPVARDSGAPRIGFCRTPAWDEADPATQALLQHTAERLAAAGAALREVSLPPPFEAILETHSRIFYFEAARNYAYEYERHRDQVSKVLRSTVLEPGRALPLAAYVEALETAEAYRRHLDDLFGEFDLLLAPSAAGEAPPGLGSTGNARFNGLWTLAWTPCLTLPAGRGPHGLPLGVQLVARRGRDRALFDAAAWVERYLQPASQPQ
jgi:Asp-tRNA(Asn)/Glu-tRNA(Gln) amidotransferase A subunit family amidase